MGSSGHHMPARGCHLYRCLMVQLTRTEVQQAVDNPLGVLFWVKAAHLTIWGTSNSLCTARASPLAPLDGNN